MGLRNTGFELRSVVITKPDESWIRISTPLANTILRQSFTHILPGQVAGTVLDLGLKDNPGVVKLVPNFEFYIHDLVTKATGFAPSSNLDSAGIRRLMARKGAQPSDIDNAFLHTDDSSWFYIPRESNLIFELDSGRAVIDHFQRAVNDLLISGHALVGLRSSRATSFQMSRAEQRYQTAITGYFKAVKKILFYKAGYLDSKLASVMPLSGRGVIVADPRIPLEFVGVPKSILHKWFTSHVFKKAYGLEDLSFEDACRKLEGMFLLFGRQPSHDCSNFFSVRLKPVEGTAIHVNPVTVNLYDGDFDGDTCHLYALLTTVGREALPSMSIERLLTECRPKRELAHLHLPKDINAANQMVRAEIERYIRGDLLGFSIDVHDLLNDDLGTGYFSDKPTIHRADLTRATLGFSKDDAWAESCEAMLDFRLIKQGVAQAGGLSNCFMQLGILEFYRMIRTEGQSPEVLVRARDILKKIQVVKHILCQGMLNRKHGHRQDSGNKSVLEMLSMMFYRFRDCPLNTREEYLKYMTEDTGLPADSVAVIVDLFFRYGSPPLGIYEILAQNDSSYVLTRNPASMFHLGAFVQGSTNVSLHDEFLRSRLTPEEEARK